MQCYLSVYPNKAGKKCTMKILNIVGKENKYAWAAKKTKFPNVLNVFKLLKLYYKNKKMHSVSLPSCP